MFYVSCNPGFEEELSAEIQECWPWLIGTDGAANQTPCPEITLDRGGVSLEAPLEFGIQLNFFLKTAHRVLWRLAEFKVRDFPKLFEKVRKISWERYLESTHVEWVVSASKSRLNHDKRIEETCQEALGKSLIKAKTAASFQQGIYVRIHDDLCTISLDSTGEHLHKRGWGTRKGEAPLRETLAAFALRQMVKKSNPAELRKITLVDPMCGSGTLILEALSMGLPNFERDYAFFHWKNTPKLFKTALWRKNYKLLNSGNAFKSYRGFDLDEKIVMAAEENLVDLRRHVSFGEADVQFKKQNLFKDSETVVCAKPVWCVSNPPYGERLRVQEQGEFSYEDLILQMAKKFAAEKIAVLLPNKSMVKTLKAPKGYKKSLEVPFSNGGLDVLLLVFTTQGTRP